jgi:hypothetical protein
MLLGARYSRAPTPLGRFRYLHSFRELPEENFRLTSWRTGPRIVSANMEGGHVDDHCGPPPRNRGV